MILATMDFETFYSTEYSLTRLTTEAYIRDPRFEVIGVSIKLDDTPTRWFTGSYAYIAKVLSAIPWHKTALLAHNTMFDAAILAWRFGIHPKRLLDTLSMGRPVLGPIARVSLKAMSEHYGVGVKGDEVHNARGLRRKDFSSTQMKAYGAYCIQDVDLTYALFQRMIADGFPKTELQLIDITLRMFTKPRLVLNMRRLEEHLQDIKATQKELLVSTMQAMSRKDIALKIQLGAEEAITEMKQLLRSNEKFADALTQLGIDPPTKISPTTGKTTFAFAKTDPAFIALQEHEDIRVQALVSARLGVKTSIEQSRTERFMDIAARGKLPIPLRYYAAHPGRWGGADRINMQNLSARGEHGGKLKQAIEAPDGYVFIEADSSQIEARMVGWLSDQHDMTQAFREKRDLYSEMATSIYGRPIDRKRVLVNDNGEEYHPDKKEGFVGKTTILGCFGGDTPVLTRTGPVPIAKITQDMEVWDGVEWVRHSGGIFQGHKHVHDLHGVWVTPEHRILCGDVWVPAAEVANNPQTSNAATFTGMGHVDKPLRVAYGGPWACLSDTNVQIMPTYDILDAGPRNRYMIITDAGPMIVHNCGYGMGGVRFQAQLRTQTGIVLPLEETTRIVNVYRDKYPMIPALWRNAQTALDAIYQGSEYAFGTNDLIEVDKDGIHLPNGFRIAYAQMHREQDEQGRWGYVYKSRTGMTRIFGPKTVENVSQALARIVVGEQMLKVNKKYEPVMTVHDSIGIIAKENERDEACAYLEQCMRHVPAWADGLPLDCEVDYGPSYGDTTRWFAPAKDKNA